MLIQSSISATTWSVPASCAIYQPQCKMNLNDSIFIKNTYNEYIPLNHCVGIINSAALVCPLRWSFISGYWVSECSAVQSSACVCFPIKEFQSKF